MPALKRLMRFDDLAPASGHDGYVERMSTAVLTSFPRAALHARVSSLDHGHDTGVRLDEPRQVAAHLGWSISTE